MSTQFTAVYEGEKFQVEISRKGEMTIPDRDIAYEEMMTVMTGEPKPILEFLDAWRENPTSVICKYLGLSEEQVVVLGCDWAEHVLRLYEEAIPNDPRPRDAIQAVRDFFDGRIDGDALEQALAAARAARAGSWKAAGAAAEAAVAAGGAALVSAGAAAEAAVAAAGAALVSAEAASSWAAWAAAEASSASSLWAEIKNAEIAWQVRHFVHVMECVQSGRDWPDIRETP